MENPNRLEIAAYRSLSRSLAKRGGKPEDLPPKKMAQEILALMKAIKKRHSAASTQ